MPPRIANKYENMLRWIPNKLRIQEKFNKNPQTTVRYPRGSIYTCFFGENIGHEKSRLEARPCVVISNNRINYNSSNVVVIPLSKEIKYKDASKTELKYEWHYVLRKSKYTLLAFDSVVQCEDIKCVSKSRMGNYICSIDVTDLNNIKKRIKKALQI
ncbi:MAG: type II toxin-antitoxin system PemK/MazF family toxin [Clostridia bacterium]|nr:type II toxin-antitoxin system PemK/MazF family toxin [Clostridia bacterium]